MLHLVMCADTCITSGRGRVCYVLFRNLSKNVIFNNLSTYVIQYYRSKLGEGGRWWHWIFAIRMLYL